MTIIPPDSFYPKQPNAGAPNKEETISGKLQGAKLKLQRTNAQKTLPKLPVIQFNQSQTTDNFIKHNFSHKKNTNNKENVVSNEIFLSTDVKAGCEKLNSIAKQLSDYAKLIKTTAKTTNNTKAIEFANTIETKSNQLKEIANQSRLGTISPKERQNQLEGINSYLRNYTLEYNRFGRELTSIKVSGMTIPKCLSVCGREIGQAQHLFKSK